MSVLPYLEGGETIDAIDQMAAWDADRNRRPTATVLRQFDCQAAADETTPRATYVGVAGVGSDAATLGVSDPRAGVFGYDRDIKIKDIKDGLATTLLIVETVSGSRGRRAAPARSADSTLTTGRTSGPTGRSQATSQRSRGSAATCSAET